MDTKALHHKLEVIRARLGMTQAALATRLGVSFAAFNAWWTGRSTPRPQHAAAIQDLYLEVTGGKRVPEAEFKAKKRALALKSAAHASVIREILDNPDIRDQFVLSLTYHSNRIEGSTLSEPETAAVLFDNVALPDKSLAEQLEAKNHQTALLFVFDHAARREKVTEALVLKLHLILMNGVRPDAGAYRMHGVRITGVNLPTANYASIARLMPRVVTEAAQKSGDVLQNVARVHARFEQIHPFSDGNGRVGRLLMAAMLLRANLPPAEIRENQKQLYYTYLYRAQTKDDTGPLERFLCDAVTEGFAILDRSFSS